MRSPVLAATVMALSAMAGPISAAPIDPINVRQEVIHAAPSFEPTLQEILTGGTHPAFANSSLDVDTDQSIYGMFAGLGQGTVDLLPTLVSENTASAKTQAFGIWFGSDSKNLLHVNLLLGAAVAGDAAALSLSNGLLQVGSGTGACGIAIACQTIRDSRISAGAFGFYFQERPINTPIFHTVDALNTVSVPTHVLSFDGGGSQWAFSYEDYRDFDYQDMVVKIGNISAVPEPGAIGLAFAGGLVAVGFRRRSAPVAKRRVTG